MTAIKIKPLDDDAEEDCAFGAILAQSFNAPPGDWPRYRDQIGRGDFRVGYRGDELVGGLAMYRMGQWFGGRSVPMAGIAGVAVAPERRGSGVGVALMRAAIAELAAEGVALSTLYPATQRPYRRVGYEQAGVRVRHAIDCHSIALEGASRRDGELAVHAIDAAKHEALHAIDRERARRGNGNLDRNAAIWGRIVDPRRGPVYAYVVGELEAPEGYTIFRHANADPDYDVGISDLVATTPQALRRLWQLLAGHRSQAGRALWAGPAVDPRVFPLIEQQSKVSGIERWMTRIVSVRAALVARGYPVGVECELHLAVSDELVKENEGKVVLTVSGGQGTVEDGGRGDMRLDVSTLAPLFTGMFTATTLSDIGKLEATPLALATADSLFSGAAPWMPDPF